MENWEYKEVPIYRVRRFGFKAFPKRSSKDVIMAEYEKLKDAQKYAIKLNTSEDSDDYDTRWYVESTTKVKKVDVK